MQKTIAKKKKKIEKCHLRKSRAKTVAKAMTTNDPISAILFISSS